MIVASLNTRGLNKLEHQKDVKQFLLKNKVSFVGLLETKISLDKAPATAQKLFKNWKWAFNYNHHHYGRVWIGWDPNFWRVTVVTSSAQFIYCHACFLPNNFTVAFTFVYAFNRGNARESLWTDLRSIANTNTLPWAVAGDFNAVLSIEEIKGGREQWNNEMQAFKDCALDCHLEDFKFTGDIFTWWNKREGSPVFKKLDRFMGNDLWLSSFPNSVAHTHARGLSDHAPLVLTVDMKLDRIPKAFQYFHFMSKLDRFQETVEKEWSFAAHGNPILAFSKKLKTVKQALIQLNKSNGNLHTNVAQLRAQLIAVQNSIAQTNDLDLMRKEKDLSSQLSKALLHEESMLAQKARVSWLTLGDSNTSFFHKQVTANWNTNKVFSLKNSQDQVVHGHKAVSNVAVDYFASSLGVASNVSSTELPPLKTVSMDQYQLLTAPVTNDIIHATLKGMKRGKAPGPDGFPLEFFLATWDIVGLDLCKAVRYFFDTGFISRDFNWTAIALVPKALNASSLPEFRPISLCTTIYKCISKILANRLKSIMPTLISQSQNAFVPNRRISDNVLMAQELFRSYGRKYGAPKCALKLDLHKAFDFINWHFLLSVLQKMNFPSKFIEWITACISTTWFLVKLNGALCGFFKGEKGLRQGDPLSPYLFCIAMEVFSALLIPDSSFTYHWKCKKLALNHLLFADDVLLFSYANKSSLEFVMKQVDVFAALSGLAPNPSKSSCFFSNCDEDFMEWFVHTYSIHTAVLPVKFLGVPLISSRLGISHCRPLIEKVLARVGSWTSKFLSFAGRLQLISSVLLAIQGYWSHLFILPKAVLKELQTVFTRFLWKGNVAAIGGAKVAWSQLCRTKMEGGLGIKCPTTWNKAQILFHLMQIASKKSSSLWARWIQSTALAGKINCFWSIPLPSDASWIWRQVLKLRVTALPYVSYHIGNGVDTSLWFEPWYKQNCISPYPASPIITCSGLKPNAKVSSIISGNIWNLPPDNMHQHHVAALWIDWKTSFDQSTHLDASKSDCITWMGIEIKKLRTKLIWEDIRDKIAPVHWYMVVWHKLLVPRHAFHFWLIVLNRLPTLVRLSNFGLPIDTHCFLCVGGSEDCDHLFLKCTYSSFILDKILGSIGLDLQFATWTDVVLWLSHTGLHKGKTALVILAFQAFTYHIWRERNARKHDGGIFTPDRLLQLIIRDVKSRLQSSLWFKKQALRNPTLLHWL